MTGPRDVSTRRDELRKLHPSARIFSATLMGLGLLWRTGLAAAEPMGKGEAALRAGACALDISPWTFPVLVSGGFLSRTADRLQDPLHARCLVLDGGRGFRRITC
jgi:hypothetical protein